MIPSGVKVFLASPDSRDEIKAIKIGLRNSARGSDQRSPTVLNGVIDQSINSLAC